MYVLCDLEWVEDAKGRRYATQLAGIRTDEAWNVLDKRSFLIRPWPAQPQDWNLPGYAGHVRYNYRHAQSAGAVMTRFSQWLEKDTLCWWNQTEGETFEKLYHILLGKKIPNQQRYIRHLLSVYLKIPEEPLFLTAEKLGLHSLGVEHCAVHDVSVMQRLLKEQGFPHTMLEESKEELQKQYPYQYEKITGIVHRRGCGLIRPDQKTEGAQSLASFIDKRCKPCSCCAADWKQALEAKNLSAMNCGQHHYFYLQRSSVFHRKGCPRILRARGRLMGQPSYQACAASGRTPCGICKPSPIHSSDGESFSILNRQKIGQEQLPLSQQEKAALLRQREAQTERALSLAEKLSCQQFRDVMNLTATRYRFWAAKGYRTFHLRHCPKLNGRSRIRGFAFYHEAIQAGYKPCRYCRPTSSSNAELSIPIANQLREDETVESVLEECGKLGLEYTYTAPILDIRTPRGEWQINIARQPIRVQHRHTDPEQEWHQQHRMFLSVTDVVRYIAQHDGLLPFVLHQD